MISKKGEIIVLASVVVEEVDDDVTIFDREESAASDIQKNGSYQDDYSEYKSG